MQISFCPRSLNCIYAGAASCQIADNGGISFVSCRDYSLIANWNACFFFLLSPKGKEREELQCLRPCGPAIISALFRVAKSVKNRNLYGLIKKSVKCQFVCSLMGLWGTAPKQRNHAWHSMNPGSNRPCRSTSRYYARYVRLTLMSGGRWGNCQPGRQPAPLTKRQTKDWGNEPGYYEPVAAALA